MSAGFTQASYTYVYVGYRKLPHYHTWTIRSHGLLMFISDHVLQKSLVQIPSLVTTMTQSTVNTEKYLRIEGGGKNVTTVTDKNE